MFTLWIPTKRAAQWCSSTATSCSPSITRGGMGTKSRIPRAALGAAIGGMPGAVWLGLAGSAGKGEWKLRVKENNDGEDHIYSCRNQYDAKKMEKRIMRNHAHRYQPGKPPSSPAPTKRQRVNSRNNAPVPPVGHAGM